MSFEQPHELVGTIPYEFKDFSRQFQPLLLPSVNPKDLQGQGATASAPMLVDLHDVSRTPRGLFQNQTASSTP